MIHHEPERDNCIIIHQNTKISRKKHYLRVLYHKIKQPQKHIHVTASFSARKPDIDLLTLHDHNKVWLQLSKIE